MRSSFLRHSEVQTQLINLFAFAGEMERVDAVTKVNALTVPLCNAMIAAATEANNFERAMEWFRRAFALQNSDGSEGTVWMDRAKGICGLQS